MTTSSLDSLLLAAVGAAPTWTYDVRGNAFGHLCLIRPEPLADAAQALAGKARLCTITVYPERRDDPGKRRNAAYHFAVGGTLLTLTVRLYDPETLQKLPVPSITPWFRNADWNEREFIEMFNIEVVGHPNPKRLFLDERLDAGIMSKLIPFSAMAAGAASNTLWEQIMETKHAAPDAKRPSKRPDEALPEAGETHEPAAPENTSAEAGGESI